MNWIACTERLPDAEGSYLVYAESADPKLPLYWVTMYHPNDPPATRWSPLPRVWSEAVSHWCELKPPANPT